jgi:hypothetical protein
MREFMFVELCGGSQIMASKFARQGFDTLTIDNNPELNNDWARDIMGVTADEILKEFGQPDVIWASPPCTSFSRASISTHWDATIKGHYRPKTDACQESIALVEHILDLMNELSPTYWFIENPRGMIKHVLGIKNLSLAYRHNVSYCQYGEKYMKPTYIFTNAPVRLKMACKEGDNCHESAPAGSKLGLQGVDGNYERAKLPEQLCDKIAESCEFFLRHGRPQIQSLYSFTEKEGALA